MNEHTYRLICMILYIPLPVCRERFCAHFILLLHLFQSSPCVQLYSLQNVASQLKAPLCDKNFGHKFSSFLEKKKRKLDFKTLHANLHSYIITHTHVNAFFTMYDYHLFSAERIVMMMALVFMRVFSCIYIIPLWE